MINEEKQLLLIDLCARLPYGVVCQYNCVIPVEKRSLVKTNAKDKLKGIIPMPNGHIGFMIGIDKIDALEGDIKPYLRPMSSMTDEDWNIFDCLAREPMQIELFKWLNAHHFDYRGLIEKGLALEAPEDMYKTE